MSGSICAENATSRRVSGPLPPRRSRRKGGLAKCQGGLPNRELWAHGGEYQFRNLGGCLWVTLQGFDLISGLLQLDYR